MRSSVEIYDIATHECEVVWQTEDLVEAPNWSRDGDFLVINGDGLLYALPLDEDDPEPELIDTGFAVRLNNDHGLSPDGASIAFSDKTLFGKSCIYILGDGDEAPRQVTANMPSYWHGWSPDGKELAYCGIRNDQFDIYTISVNGGAERRLTSGEGRNDGPDYSPDGQWIYFNSSRTGLMQIWRMHPDGTGLEQLTSDGYGDWFPHPSPDGSKVLFLSYDADVFDHPRDKTVRLRLMDADGGNVETLFEFFGGQGSINVPNWSPDGSAFAFVRYFPE
ncbi:PD40 domain-containing protein [Ciceribacter sp. L1K22]|uniref:TolB family protein n=1 Tax=Ciceribacter sp. L1K22 TaxID=2820275 RepID=UPI001ABDC4FF|nr:PD40 domain-containing protein [Ciceribacter sp. L1K22]MBO3760685.1 TolB family protein [Ciceribacter sp. L1K22]